ncbi:glycerophosphodiester phosphodiesterase family protein [Paenibacillus lutrae]|uniref:glycerophosphodiester phosphodiesterase family protein n=1 Tax=Paenibacillus lutrae TaxID=2078573 RepID=UPI0030845BA4
MGVLLALVSIVIPLQAGLPHAQMADTDSKVLESSRIPAGQISAGANPGRTLDKAQSGGQASHAKGETGPQGEGKAGSTGAGAASKPSAAGNKLIPVMEPDTRIALAPTIVTELQNKEELSKLKAPALPATLILHVNSGLIVTDPAGKTELGSLETVLSTVDGQMIPAFYVKNKETVDRLVSMLKRKGIEDAFVVSDQGELVKRARTEYPVVRGIVDFSAAGDLSREGLMNIRRQTTKNLAKIAIMPAAASSREAVNYLQQRLIVVWAKEISDAPRTNLAVHTLITAGVNGIVTDSPKIALGALKLYSHEKTLVRKPYIIAHRGMPSKAPENTIISGRLGLEAGADFIENDMYLTKDGHLVIIHDPVVESTTNGKGKVEDFTLAQLKKLNANKLFPSGYPNVQIPTLEEQIDLARSKGKMILAEMKSKNPAAMEKLVQVIRDKNAEDLMNVMSFDAEQLRRLSELMPEMPCGLLTGEIANESKVDQSLSGTLKLMQVRNTTLNTTYSGLGQNFMEAAKHRGLIVSPWTFNDKANFMRYFGYGAYGITTDYAFWASDWAASVTPGIEKVVLDMNESTGLSVIVETFKGTRTDSKAEIIVLDGQDKIVVSGGKVTAKEQGTAHVLLRYTASIEGGGRYDLYTQPVTLEVSETGGAAVKL